MNFNHEEIMLEAIGELFEQPELRLEKWKKDRLRSKRGEIDTGLAQMSGFHPDMITIIDHMVGITTSKAENLWIASGGNVEVFTKMLGEDIQKGVVTWWGTDGGNGGNVEAGIFDGGILGVAVWIKRKIFGGSRTPKAESGQLKKGLNSDQIYKVTLAITMKVLRQILAIEATIIITRTSREEG